MQTPDTFHSFLTFAFVSQQLEARSVSPSVISHMTPVYCVRLISVNVHINCGVAWRGRGGD